MKIVASYAIKGGVGKTAIAVNLAHSAVAAGYRTLLWDLDEQGGASAILGQMSDVVPRRARRTYQLREHIRASPWTGLDLLPAESLIHLLDRHDRPRHLRELIDKVRTAYDRVILDCPPTLGFVAEQIFELADIIVVPVVPSTLSINAFQQLQSYAAARSGGAPELVPVFSMVDRRRASHKAAIEADPERIAIPYAVAMERMAALGQPIAADAPNSPAARPLAELWQTVERRLAAGDPV